MSAYVAPASARVASAAPTTSKCVGRVAGRASRARLRCATTTVTAASGRLIRKIQRQAAYSISQPPTNGPIAVAMPPSPDQAPIAAARSRWHERALDHRQAARRQQRGADALEDPGGDQHLGVGARPQSSEARREQHGADHEDPAPAEAVAERAAEQDQAESESR